MKKPLLFLLLLLSAMAHSQVTAKDKKPSDETKKAVLPKTAVPKSLLIRDTVKVEKTLATVEPELKINDTVIVFSGKFKPYKKNAHASYYANKFNGKRTSSGKRFDNNKYTAAHRKFPFGTILRVTNEENGKWVLVEVIDRGPFSRGREIDLTRRAFQQIGTNKNSGSLKVTIEVANQ